MSTLKTQKIIRTAEEIFIRWRITDNVNAHQDLARKALNASWIFHNASEEFEKVIGDEKTDKK